MASSDPLRPNAAGGLAERLARVRAVVFDLDDTLYPELDFVRGGFAAAAALAGRFGVDARVLEAAMEEELQKALDQRRRAARVFDTVLQRFSLPTDAETVDWLVAAYRERSLFLTPYPDARPTLETLAGRVLIGLITDGPWPVQRAKFAALGLEEYFNAIVFTDEIGPDAWKPSPAPYEAVERMLGVVQDALVYVADDPQKDFIGARGRGWITLRIRRPDSLHGGLEPGPGYGPDGEIETLVELLALTRKGP